MKSVLKLALAGVAGGLFSVAAMASDAAKTCVATPADGVKPDQIIDACSEVISAADNPMSLAPAYYNRGNAYYDKKDWANAIADFTKALSIRPKFPSAMSNRGLAKKHAGDIAGGDADIAAAKAMAK